MNKARFLAALALVAALILGVLAFSIFFVSDHRKDELAAERESAIAEGFINRGEISAEDLAFLRSGSSAHFSSILMQQRFLMTEGDFYRLCTRALSAGIESRDIYDEMARYFEKRNEKQEAIAMYIKALGFLEGDSRWKKANYMKKIGELYYSLNDYRNAAEYLSNYLRLTASRDGDIIFRHAYCNVQLGNLDEALTKLEAAASASPTNPSIAQIYNLIGVIYEKKGMLDKARQNYEQSLSISNARDVRANLDRIELQIKEKGRSL